MRESISLERGPFARRGELVGDASSIDGERLVLDAEGLGRADFEGARRHGVHLVPGSVTLELDEGLAESTDAIAATLDELGLFVVSLELAKSARRFKAFQPRRQVAGVRAERRYVDGWGRRGHCGVALPIMLVRGLVPRHSRGPYGTDLNCRVQSMA